MQDTLVNVFNHPLILAGILLLGYCYVIWIYTSNNSQQNDKSGHFKYLAEKQKTIKDRQEKYFRQIKEQDDKCKANYKSCSVQETKKWKTLYQQKENTWKNECKDGQCPCSLTEPRLEDEYLYGFSRLRHLAKFHPLMFSKQ